MQNNNSMSYNGYLILGSAEQLVSTQRWVPKLSISKPNSLEPKNVQEHFFAGLFRSDFATEAEAVDAAIKLGQKIIDKEVPGLPF